MPTHLLFLMLRELRNKLGHRVIDTPLFQESIKFVLERNIQSIELRTHVETTSLPVRLGGYFCADFRVVVVADVLCNEGTVLNDKVDAEGTRSV